MMHGLTSRGLSIHPTEESVAMTEHTPLPWLGKPHLIDDSTSCNCTSWCEETYAGGILTINVNNGISSISEGGNDAPPLDVAKANAMFVDKAIHQHYPLMEALADLHALYAETDRTLDATEVCGRVQGLLYDDYADYASNKSDAEK